MFSYRPDPIHTITLIFLLISCAIGLHYIHKAQNLERDLAISNQNLKAAMDSTRLVWQDSIAGVQEHARIAFASKQKELEQIVSEFSQTRRRLEGRISTLTATVATLRTRLTDVPTVVTHDTLRSSTGLSGVVKLDWAWSERHGLSRLDIRGQSRYFPEPDSGSTDIDSLALRLALLVRTGRAKDGTIQTAVTSDWPGLGLEVNSHVDQDLFFPKPSFWRKAWSGVKLGGAFAAGFGACRVAG